MGALRESAGHLSNVVAGYPGSPDCIPLVSFGIVPARASLRLRGPRSIVAPGNETAV
jgi:hypothetical protein